MKSFKVGDIVKYNPKWCTPGEEKYIHIVREIRLNPVTNKETRCLIETLNTSLFLNPQEVVDFEMIDFCE